MRFDCVFDILAAVVAVLASFTLAVIHYGVGHIWHSLRSLGITAYRKITDLRPVYRESYETHGLSLEPDRMRS
ncbi:hypothetical protein LJR235_002906 [Pararhizobium sp. LjRoot235]|uniref:hypothetical protein n=1 Tax=Pararhizobium sp. LjRoot235 TaxID=3342291 RepID=UPI003ED15B69